MKIPDIKGAAKKILGQLKELAKKAKIPKIKDIRWKDAKVKKQAIVIAILVVVGLVIIVRTTSNIQKVLFKKKPEIGKKIGAVTFEEEAIPVKVYKVKKTDFKDTLPAMGNIKGFREIDLKFQVSGMIESFNFEEGEKIQKGNIISSIIQKEALLKLKYSEIETKKNQKLFDIGAISQIKLDQAKLEYESAKSELDKTNIYAVTNGFLGTKLMDPGSYAAPNDRVGTFISIDKVYASFSIVEKDVPKIALGQKVEVFVDSYPNKSFSGTIDRIAPIIEGRSRTEEVKIEIDNKDGLLKPGMFVRGLIATYEKKDALVIPSSGLKKKEADYFVYAIHKDEPKKEDAEPKKEEKPKKGWSLFKPKKKEDPEKAASKEKENEFGAVELRKIKLGYMTQDLVEVAEGLKEDEFIALEIQEEMKDKSRVEITEVQEGLI